MWTNEQRERYHLLRDHEQASSLTAEEAAELTELMQELCDDEAVYLAPANARKAQEIAELTAAVERVETENQQLREYLSERFAFLERVKSMVARIQAEDQEMRERFAEVLAVRDKQTTQSSS